MTFDPFGARDQFDTGHGNATLYRMSRLEDAGLGEVSKLPFSIRMLLEAVLRNCDGFPVTEQDVKNLASWNAAAPAKQEVPFKPFRVVLQDFTGVPAVVDLAAMRSAMERIGGDPKKINPLIPVDLVIDHSVQVDFFGTDSALAKNVDIEFARNRERYEFLRWGQQAFDNFRVDAAQRRNRAPSQSGVLGARASSLQRNAGRSRRDSRYVGRYRQPYNHDQWSRRAGLGRRRHRSRSQHAGPTAVHADARSDRFRVDR